MSHLKIPQLEIQGELRHESLADGKEEGVDVDRVNRAKIRNAALSYLARFGTTRSGLVRVLTRRVTEWHKKEKATPKGAVKQETGLDSGVADAGLNFGQDSEKIVTQDLKGLVDDVVQEMVDLGLVSDYEFARSCANRFMRTGRSIRAVEGYLTGFGVEESVKDSVLNKQEESDRFNETERDLCAAVVLARKRKLGPFASSLEVETETNETTGAQPRHVEKKYAEKKRALGIFARAGFVRDIAERVLTMDEEEAWQWLNRMRTES
ncbi:MAG: RecX family transcriptional regulator [Acetobacter sp.]|nr:RecX family transcriptional regulator [Acetobacter sp.]